MTNGVIKNSSTDLKPKSSPSEDDDDDENNDHTNAEVQANETSIMNLLLAAAAKSQKQPNGMAKAVCKITKKNSCSLDFCQKEIIIILFFWT